MNIPSAKPPPAILLNRSDDPAWDAFIQGRSTSLVYHTTGWRNALESAFPHIRGYFFVIRNETNQQIVAGLPVYSVKSWLTGRRLVSVPFAPISDPVASTSAEVSQLVSRAMELEREEGAKYLEVRVTHGGQLFSETPLKQTSSYLHHYIALKGDPQATFRSFSRTAVQQEIKKAQKSGTVVRACNDASDYKAFHAVLSETRKRLSLPAIPQAFFMALHEKLGPQCILFAASNGGTLVGSLLVTHYGRCCSAEFIGDRRADTCTSTSHLLYWSAIQWAIEKGYTQFSFGRTANSNQDLIRFKQRWGTTEEETFAYSDEIVTSKPGRESSFKYRTARQVIRHLPTPLYHQMGNFLYRHMG